MGPIGVPEMIAIFVIALAPVWPEKATGAGTNAWEKQSQNSAVPRTS